MILQRLNGIADWLGDLSANVFWGTLTSYPAISVMGVVAVASFAVAHIPLIERFFPSIAAFTRVAGLVSLMSSAALMFAFGYRVADGRDEIERLKNDLAWTDFMLGEQRAAADDAAELKKQADAETETAKGKLDDYKRLFGDKPSVFTPPPGFLEWLHSLQRHKSPTAGADQPKRNLVARVRAAGAKRQ